MPDRPPRAATSRRPVRVAVAVARDGIRTRVAHAALERLALYVLRAEKVRDAMLSIALVSPRAIAGLNRAHLGHPGSTDVISFGLKSHVPGRASPVVGDIYICPAVARANAARFGVAQRDELERLVVHGTLHVLGWDHATGARREGSAMWTRQEQLLRGWRRKRTAR